MKLTAGQWLMLWLFAEDKVGRCIKCDLKHNLAALLVRFGACPTSRSWPWRGTCVVEDLAHC